LSTNDPDVTELWQEVLAWIKVARADQRAATLCVQSDPPLHDVAAFHCQQAAEKLLKAFLVRANQDFGKTHDLAKLGYLVTMQFPSITPLVTAMQDWTAWSVAYRYPGEAGPEPEPSAEELSRAPDLIARLESALRSLAPNHNHAP